MEFHVIDDEKHVGDVIVDMLNAHGFSSIAFNCPRQYLEHARSSEFKKPVAVFTDITMPGINGYEMIDELRKIYPDQKFVVISASSDVRHPAISEVGMFLSKPLRMETLGKAAASLIQCHKDGPSSNPKCMEINEYARFLNDWKCPHCSNCCQIPS